MKIVESYEKAVALGAETIIKDSEDRYRVYFPGEIQRPPIEEQTVVTDTQPIQETT